MYSVSALGLVAQTWVFLKKVPTGKNTSTVHMYIVSTKTWGKLRFELSSSTFVRVPLSMDMDNGDLYVPENTFDHVVDYNIYSLALVMLGSHEPHDAQI